MKINKTNKISTANGKASKERCFSSCNNCLKTSETSAKDDHVSDSDKGTNKECAISKETILLLMTVLAVAMGIAAGLSFRAFGKDGDEAIMTRRQLMYLEFPGELFMRMLKMLILPLMLSSIVSSVAQLNTQTAGRLGAYTMMYFMSTTLIALIEGIILVMAIRPGNWSKGNQPDVFEREPACLSRTADTILDLIRNLFPDNLIQACFSSVKTCLFYANETIDDGNKTKLVKIPPEIAMNFDESERAEYAEYFETKMRNGSNIIGLIIFAMVFGVIISTMKDEGTPLKNLFISLESSMMKMISLVIWVAPVGILFMTMHHIVEMKDPSKELYRLTGYVITVLIGLAIHGFIVLPLITFVFARRNPYKFAYRMLPALLTALGTSSSTATLPLTMKCCEENNGIDRRVTRFVLPLGATINMDGTALYEAVAAIYIAQTIGEPMTIGRIILISLTATLASIGAAPIPQAGIVTMVLTLTAIGLPTKWFVLVIPADWFLDRFRTLTNVHGDSLGTAVVNRCCKRFLHEQDLKASQRKKSKVKTEKWSEI